MPRFLSSYAANKRVEDGLRRKQEQIRQEYVRARHRYMDETEKLVHDLLQIHVKTPSAFARPAPPGSAPSLTRPSTRNSVFPPMGSAHSHQQLPHHLSSHEQQKTTAEILHEASQALGRNDVSLMGNQASLQSYSGGVADGKSNRPRSSRIELGDGSRSAPVRRVTNIVPASNTPQAPPVVEVRGKEVFYQYDDGRPRNSGWKKLEPAYRTKMLLHRNNTVSQALSRQQQQNKVSDDDVNHITSNEENQPNFAMRQESRKGSEYGSLLTPEFGGSRRDSEFSRRRESIFSRRGSSRRGSRFFQDFDDEIDTEEEERAARFARLMQQQLSPGHTPRMLDGWTIMNWCLWSKQDLGQKPVWASKRYREKKLRELKRYQAARTREKAELPAKPQSASAKGSRGAQLNSCSEENDDKQVAPRRVKSVPPLQSRDSIVLEGVVEVDEGEEEVVNTSSKAKDTSSVNPSTDSTEPERGILRPTTSILRRTPQQTTFSGEIEESGRPKTTKPRRRVALNTFIQQQGSKSTSPRGVSTTPRTEHTQSNKKTAKTTGSTEKDYQDNSLGSHQSKMGKVLRTETGERRLPNRAVTIKDIPDVLDSSKMGPETPREVTTPKLVLTRPGEERADLEQRKPGLAATKIAASSRATDHNKVIFPHPLNEHKNPDVNAAKSEKSARRRNKQKSPNPRLSKK